MSDSLTEVLDRLYAHEINVRIESFWDGGWDASLGDVINGWIDPKPDVLTANTLQELAGILDHTARRLFPTTYGAKP